MGASDRTKDGQTRRRASALIDLSLRLLVSSAIVFIGPPLFVTARAQGTIGQANQEALAAWRSRSTNKIVINFSNLPVESRDAAIAQLIRESLSQNLTIGHFIPSGPPVTGNRDIIIKRQVVDGIENLISGVQQVHPDARLVWASGYRTPPQQQSASGPGTIAGPHVRGDAVDISFELPGMSSRDSAVLTAQTAKAQGIKGIALDSDREGTSYSAHLDFRRTDTWYAEQVHKAKTDTTTGKKVWSTSYSTSSVSWIDGTTPSTSTPPSSGSAPPRSGAGTGAGPTSRIDIAPGGVLLDRAADLLGDLGEIVGATFDSRTNQVILIGKSDISLPPFDRDDLAVALRAMQSGEPLGVSIDPSDDPRRMRVRYFGGAVGTALGNVMFEADRVLKILGLGVDNITGARVGSRVRGFQTVVSLESSDFLGGGGAHYRFWFRPKHLEMQRTITGNSVRYTNADIECLVVKNESSALGTAAQRFVDHLNEHYEDFAAELPVLARLKQLAQVVGVAYWLRQRGLDVDLAKFEITPVDTRQVTPATTVTGPRRQSGDLVWTTSITGGVDLSTRPTYVPDTARAAASLSSLTLTSRPKDVSNGGWEFEVDQEKFVAVAVPVRVRAPVIASVQSGITLAAPSSPTVTSFLLTQDGPATTMILNGLNFGRRTETSAVTVGGRAVPIQSWSDTRIAIQLPYSAAESEYEIIVTRSGGRSAPMKFVAAPNAAAIIRRIRGSQYATLPPLSAAPGGTSTQTSVTISNQTPYPLRACLVGPTVLCRIVSAGGITSLSLQLGSYEVGIDALAGLVVPLYSVWQIDPGRTYEMLLRLK